MGLLAVSNFGCLPGKVGESPFVLACRAVLAILADTRAGNA
jgi:hypothetical protein